VLNGDFRKNRLLNNDDDEMMMMIIIISDSDRPNNWKFGTQQRIVLPPSEYNGPSTFAIW